MNAQQKAIVKIEVCRELLEGLTSDEHNATLLWMAEESDNAFVGVCSDPTIAHLGKDLAVTRNFMTNNLQAIKEPVPEDLTALFLIAAMNYIFGDLHGTKKFKYVESLLDGCYELDVYTGEEAVAIRRSASVFADNLDNLINRG